MTKPEVWNELITHLPNRHILQTWEWGDVKSRYTWKPEHLVWVQQGSDIQLKLFDPHNDYRLSNLKAAALVLNRSIKLMGYTIKVSYVPKGPILDWDDRKLRQKVLQDLIQRSRKDGTLFIKIDPDVEMGYGLAGQEAVTDCPMGSEIQNEMSQSGWRLSLEQIQFRNTVILDIKKSEEELLAGMKQKTRYNIRLAQRKGVRIRNGSKADFSILYKMYAETSVRDGFVIRNREYYEDVWRTFLDNNFAEILIAHVDDEPVAGLILFSFAGKSWYLYGMSRQIHREKMPNYLLQWEAIRRSKNNGSLVYDMWGAPDRYSEDDSMWGVYKFKEGLGGTVVRHIGAWDFPIKTGLYSFYTQLLPQILGLMRRRGQDRTRQQVGL